MKNAEGESPNDYPELPCNSCGEPVPVPTLGGLCNRCAWEELHRNVTKWEDDVWP